MKEIKDFLNEELQQNPPRCQWCGAPAKYVIMSIMKPMGVEMEEKHIFCKNCISRRTEEVEHAGGKMLAIRDI